ncbi:RNA polymerase sigma factor [Sphingobacterium lactis]|uniref:RNA polymerase sigma factor n=1 Tax=Sphingobacterium lactis TaxID=797291 RepID=UPI003F7F2512
MNEFELWNLLQEGDEAAFAQVYHQYVDALYGYGQNLGYEAADIEDAIQELFVKIYHKRGQYQTVKNLKVYLFIALKNTLLNKRSKVKVIELNPELHDAEEASMEEQWILKEQSQIDRQLLKEGLAQLSPRQKQVLYFRFFKTMSFKQIAEHLQINPQSAKNIAQSAVKKLKAFLTLLILLVLLFS